jgi:AraC-like DNA-binding protein
MATDLETPLTYRPLYESAVASVSDYHCRDTRGGPAAEEHSSVNSVVLMRHGAFCRHFGRRSVTADVNQAVFFSRGSTYRVSHPADCGDRGSILTLEPGTLNDIIREFDPSIDNHPEQPFPFAVGPCDPDLFWRGHEFARRLEAAEFESGADASEASPSRSAPGYPDALWVDVTALQLVARALESAFARHGIKRKRRRDGTDVDHADRAEAAKAYLAGHLGERVTLENVARAAGASPFHLARVFQAQTGAPVHRYLTRLRLRASLERLAEGARDLTALALELGFSSHSHFTDTFRREFGCAPSEIRRTAVSRRLREMSKILEV